jgi:hypothetical protein
MIVGAQRPQDGAFFRKSSSDAVMREMLHGKEKSENHRQPVDKPSRRAIILKWGAS